MVQSSCDPALMEGPEKSVTVLTLTASDEDHLSLTGILHRSNWKIHHARNCGQALEVLRSQRIPVIVSDCKLPDGCWKDILFRCGTSGDAPLLIVASPYADEYLWAEVLNLGGYDVLAKPFEPDEVIRIVSLAWLHWKNKVRSLCTLRAIA